MTNVNNVSVGKPKVGGAVHAAPAGTTAPVNAVAALSDDFKDLGYISDEGVKNNGERSTNKIKAWGGDVVASVQTEKNDNFTMTFIECMNENVMKLAYGSGNVSGDMNSGLTVLANSEELEEWVIVVDMILKGGIAKRLVIPRGKIDSISEITYEDEELIGYQCEITALPDSAGNTHYEYFKSTGGSVIPDLSLTSLVIEGVELTPAFQPTVTSYRAATSDTSNAVTVTAADESATVIIKYDGNTEQNGQPVQWTSGAKLVTVTVSKNHFVRTYNVAVTKS